MKEIFEFNQTVARHIDRRKFFGWFLGLALPFTIAMSFLVPWHNDFVGDVRPVHLLLRGVISLIGYAIVMTVVYFKAVRPAYRKAIKEIEQRTSGNPADQP